MELIFNKNNNETNYKFVEGDLVLSSASCGDISLDGIISSLIDEELNNIKIFDLSMENEDLTNEEILKEFAENFEWIHEFKNDLINKKIDKILYIYSIENNSDIKGLGTQLFQEISKNYDCVMLIPLSEVIDFWENLGFEDLGNNHMVLLKK